MERRVILWLVMALVGIGVHGIEIVHGPYLQNLADNEVTVVWVTDVPSVAWAELAPDDDTNYYAVERERIYDTTNGVKRTDRVHSVRIPGLEPGKSYRYRVYGQEVLSHEGEKVLYGQTAATDVYSKEPLKFKTSDMEDKTTSFAVFNDIHGNNALLENLYGACTREPLDFVVFNGDMVSHMDDEKMLFDGFMDTAVRLFASETPMYYVRGNHETRGQFATEFQRYFSPKQPHLYFMQRRGPVCLIMLDTGEDKPDSDIEYYGITDYQRYREEQALWLSDIVKSDEYKDALYKVVIAHIPPTDTWYGNRQVKELFVPILEGANADIMICGHEHEYSVLPKDEGQSFPVLINDNETAVVVNATDESLTLRVLRPDGSLVDSLTINPK